MRKPVFFAGLMLWLVAGVLAFVASRQPAPAPAVDPAEPPRIVNPTGKRAIKIRPVEPSTPPEIPDDWEPPVVTGWSLTNQDGETVTPESLLGKPYVGTFIFTRCTTHCPDLVRRVFDLNQRLEDIDVRFVTVSVDPDYDTVEHLKKYADNFGAEADRWMFLTGDKDEILKFAKFGFRQLPSEPLDAESFIGPQAAHSLRLMHVGSDGRTVGTYHFRSEDDLLALRRVLEGKAETRDEHKPLPPAAATAKEENEEEAEPEPTASISSDVDRTFVAFQEEGGIADRDVQASEEVQGSEAVDEADPLASLPNWARRLPPVNAGLNAIATVFLLAGYVAIKKKRPRVHRNLMFATLAVSAVFLGCYLVYHWALHEYTDAPGKPFPGTGVAKAIYYSILIPHMILAATVPFLAGLAVWRALQQRWQAHKRIVRWAYPIWLFVSVTGVVIYGMLYHWPSGPA